MTGHLQARFAAMLWALVELAEGLDGLDGLDEAEGDDGGAELPPELAAADPLADGLDEAEGDDGGAELPPELAAADPLADGLDEAEGDDGGAELPPELAEKLRRAHWFRQAAALREAERSIASLGDTLFPRWFPQDAALRDVERSIRTAAVARFGALRRRTLAWVRANPRAVDRYAAELADEAAHLVDATVAEPHRTATLAALVDRVEAWPLLARGDVLDLPFRSPEVDTWPGDRSPDDGEPGEWAAVALSPLERDAWPGDVAPDDVAAFLRSAPATRASAAAAVVLLAYRDARPDWRAWNALRALVEPRDPPPALVAAARVAAGGDEAPDDDVARLAIASRARLRELLHEAGLAAEPATNVSADGDDGGRLAADEAAAAFLSRPPFGAAGRDVAAPLRSGAAKRWATYRAALDAGDPPPHRARAELWRTWLPREDGAPAPIVGALAAALWADVVAPALERERRTPPAVVAPVALAVGLLHRPGNRLRGAPPGAADVATAEGEHVAPVNLALAFGPDRERGGAALACTPAGVVSAILDRLPQGAERLGTLLGHRLLRWELVAAHAAALAGGPTSQTVRVPGGWTGLAAAVLGTPEPNRKEARDLREIVAVQRTAALVWPDGGVGPMVLVRERDDPDDPRRSWIELTFPAPMLPGYVHTLRKGPARALVPLVELPPLLGTPQLHGPQAALQWALLVELRERADEYAERGSVELSPPRWGGIADRAAFPTRTRRRDVLAEVLAHWTAGTFAAPPFLTRPGPWRFALAAGGPYHGAHLFLVDAGRMTQAGRRAGKASAARRRSPHRPRPKPRP